MKKNIPTMQAKKLNIKPVIVINLKGNLECLIMPNIAISKRVKKLFLDWPCFLFG